MSPKFSLQNEFEIYFTDLNKEAQKRFLQFEKIQTPKQGNFDVFPVAVVYRNTEEKKEEGKSKSAERTARTTKVQKLSVKKR